MRTEVISDLIKAQVKGFSLDQIFYQDPNIYQRELDRIFMRSWLYVGHACQIPETGDYFLYELANESVIITRDSKDSIKGLINVCRHRGSRICLKSSGQQKSMICPYHGWVYKLDGSLLGANRTPASFDKSKYSLKQVQLKIFHGMIFINFDNDPVSFDPIKKDLDECLQPYGLENMKIAHKQSYPIKSNWKLAVENYCECYHCIPAHPEYSVAHGLSLPDEKVADMLAQVMDKAEEVGLTKHCINKDWLNSGDVGNERGFSRYPLLKGFLTGSRDGKPLAPLLGSIKDYDGGTTDIHIGPVTFYLAYCDHIVIYHFKPLTIDTADCEITWLVNDKAVEGKDYKLDELTWLWDVTTTADKRIIENNQAGVNSRFYQPGPFTEMENYENDFIQWYLDVMK